jgi:hypothetical protein
LTKYKSIVYNYFIKIRRLIMTLITSLKKLSLDDRIAPSSASEPKSSTTTTPAFLAGRSVEREKSKDNGMELVPAAAPVLSTVSCLPPVFKEKFGLVGKTLADALPSLSLDVVGIIAGYLRLEFDLRHLKEKTEMEHIYSLGDETERKHIRSAVKRVVNELCLNQEGAKELCQRKGVSILQQGKLGFGSRLREVYFHTNNFGLVLEMSQCVKRWPVQSDLPCHTFLILDRDCIKNFLRTRSL